MRSTFWVISADDRIKKKGAGRDLSITQDNACVIPEGGIPAGLQGPPVMEHHALCPDNSPLPYLNSLCCNFSTIQKVVGICQSLFLHNSLAVSESLCFPTISSLNGLGVVLAQSSLTDHTWQTGGCFSFMFPQWSHVVHWGSHLEGKGLFWFGLSFLITSGRLRCYKGGVRNANNSWLLHRACSSFC